MKHITGTAFFLFCIGNLVFSQTSTDSLAHTWGLRFSFEGLSVRGGLGSKLWLTHASAVALDIAVEVSSYHDGSYHNESRSIDATFNYEHHFLFTKNMSFFAVASPIVGFTKYSGSSYGYPSTYWTFGFGVGIGVEYWPDDNISLSAVQSLSYNRRYKSEKDYGDEIFTARALGMKITLYF